jgi:hypothetical protein
VGACSQRRGTLRSRCSHGRAGGPGSASCAKRQRGRPWPEPGGARWPVERAAGRGPGRLRRTTTTTTRSSTSGVGGSAAVGRPWQHAATAFSNAWWERSAAFCEQPGHGQDRGTLLCCSHPASPVSPGRCVTVVGPQATETEGRCVRTRPRRLQLLGVWPGVAQVSRERRAGPLQACLVDGCSLEEGRWTSGVELPYRRARMDMHRRTVPLITRLPQQTSAPSTLVQHFVRHHLGIFTFTSLAREQHRMAVLCSHL